MLKMGLALRNVSVLRHKAKEYCSYVTSLDLQVFGGSNSSTSVSGGGSGYVKNITFSNFSEDNVDNPILIDQVSR